MKCEVCGTPTQILSYNFVLPKKGLYYKISYVTFFSISGKTSQNRHFLEI